MNLDILNAKAEAELAALHEARAKATRAEEAAATGEVRLAELEREYGAAVTEAMGAGRKPPAPSAALLTAREVDRSADAAVETLTAAAAQAERKWSATESQAAHAAMLTASEARRDSIVAELRIIQGARARLLGWFDRAAIDALVARLPLPPNVNPRHLVEPTFGPLRRRLAEAGTYANRTMDDSQWTGLAPLPALETIEEIAEK